MASLPAPTPKVGDSTANIQHSNRNEIVLVQSSLQVDMPKSSKKATRTRHGARRWILKALESTKDGASMRTSELMHRASQLSGSKIPGYSVYQALRTLVKNEVVAARREGREFTYRLSAARKRPSTTASAPAPSPAPTPAPVTPSPAVAPVAATPSTAAPVHTLAPGEVAILHIGETHIESATNQHGQLVLARHKRPK